METAQEIIDFLILYFQSRNIQNWNFVGYKQIKSLITYITGIKDVEQLRNLFEKMIKIGWFVKRRTGSKTDYKFVYSLEATELD
tara:strand:+ start:2241 stop:2492 length:252 start_codon:yes stop_codon:yes gene_type:complete